MALISDFCMALDWYKGLSAVVHSRLPAVLNERTRTRMNHAYTVWRHGIFPTTSRASSTPTAAVFGRRHPRSWWLDVHGCPPSAIEHFRWLAAASGTVCRLTLPHLQRWLFFGIASKLSFSPDHFLTDCFPFLVLYAVYCSGLAVLYLGHSK